MATTRRPARSEAARRRALNVRAELAQAGDVAAELDAGALGPTAASVPAAAGPAPVPRRRGRARARIAAELGDLGPLIAELAADTGLAPANGARPLAPVAPPTPRARATAPPPAAATAPPRALPRPWSTAAAAEPLPPLAPVAATAAPAPRRRSPLMLVVVAIAGLVAVATVVVSRLDLARTPAPPFTVNGLVTVSAAGTVGVGQHFAAGISQIDYVCSFTGAAAGDSLEIVVTTTTPAGTAATVAESRHTVPTGEAGQIQDSLRAGPGGFAPGEYTLEARRRGAVVARDRFVVDPATAAASPGATPGAPPGT